MVTLAEPTLDQQIRLDAVAIDGRLAARRLVTTRTSGIANALAGRPVTELPQILSRVFPLCGMAHAAAGLAAIEAALRVEVSPAQLAYRELILLAEQGAALGWRFLMDWPALLGETAQARACADIRRAVAAVSGSVARGQWPRIGGTTLRLDRDEFVRAVSALARMLVELFPETGDRTLSWGVLERALQRGRSTPARLIKAARAGAMADYGRHDRPLLASMSADWFADRLAADNRFSDAPTFDGTPAEVGPLAAQRHPLVADAIAHWGPTIATRLLAAALDAPAVAALLRGELDRLADDDPAEIDLAGSGRGAAVVDTARGPLAYLVDVADGRANMLRSVAPTEWNFHTNGPFVAALEAAPTVPDPVFAARLLAASFDPCVPFSIGLSAGHRPPIHAEVALHA